MHDFNKRELIETITPVIENTSMRYGLIPIEVSLEKENNRWFLRIFIWKREGVSHLDCENISRSLGDMLDDVIPFKYYLEVSSPGLDRRFKSDREYMIFKGHEIILKLKSSVENIDKKTLSCTLLDYLEGFGIKISYEGLEFDIPKEKIQSAKLNDKIEINKIKGEEND